MNVNLNRVRLLTHPAVKSLGLSVVLLGLPAFGWAFDPFQTLPDVIKSGVTLPGDDAPLPCPAQKDFSTPLALGEAVDLALCSNPKIQVTWAEIKVQAGALGEAQAAYLPVLSGSVSRLNDKTTYPGSNLPTSDLLSNMTYGSLTWRMFDFGDRLANRRVAESMLAAALASHDATLQKTLTAVIQAYFDVFTTRAVVLDKTQNEEIARHTLASAKNREAKGLGGQSDTLQAMTALAKVSLEKNRAEGAYQKALSVLVYALGIPVGTRVMLPEDLDDKTAVADNDLNKWLEDAQKNHPAIIAARAQLEAARDKVIATRSDGLPTIDFTANYYQNGRPGQGLTSISTHETTIGVLLTIPIFDGFSRNYKIRGAQAQVEEKEATLTDTEHQILSDVVNAYADNISALQNLEASSALLKAAADALEVTQRKYGKGAADIMEMLGTQSALADAQQERIRCLAEWRGARLKLLASAGQMGRLAARR